jgi:NADP-dependent 3-hydroxy acid dehydrogenase YdfG
MINISSVAGRRTHPGAAVYNLTKYGVVGLSGALRQELKDQHVRMSVVEPGLVDTELPVHSRPAIKEQLAKLIGGIERLKPQDVAEIVAFIITRPARVLLDEVMITPTAQNF